MSSSDSVLECIQNKTSSSKSRYFSHRPSSDIDSDTDTEHPVASTSTNPYFTKKKTSSSRKNSQEKAVEVLVLSDSDDDESAPRSNRPRPGSSKQKQHRPATKAPEYDEDKIGKALREIQKAVGDGFDREKAFAMYKKTGQDIKATIEKLREREKAKGKGKGKEKEVGKGTAGKEGQKRKRAQVEIEDEEIDELESDPEDDEMDERDYWLDVEKRDQAWDDVDSEIEQTYKKAAQFQLRADYNKVNEAQIRFVFKSDACRELYAPAWLRLLAIKKKGELILVEKARDMDNKLAQKTGKKVPREQPESSRKLELEMNWLMKYRLSDEVKGAGKGKGKGKGKGEVAGKGKGKAKEKDSQPPKKKSKLDNAPLHPGMKAIGKSTQSSSKSASTSSHKAQGRTKRPQPAAQDSEEEDELERGEGWGGAAALATAPGHSKKKKNRTDRYSVFQGGKVVKKEGTVAFSGTGRTLE
ncbi:hypothetical protein JCM16303_001834 [Sporobolomyces ruberrimus]